MRKYLLFAVILIGLLTQSLNSEAQAIKTLYSDSAIFKIDKTMVSGGTDLIDFVYLISIDADDELRNSGPGKILSNGFDVAFAARNSNVGTEYKFFREKYDGATGQLIIWIQLDLSATVDTEFVMFYGRSGETDKSDNTVWTDGNYVGVWQLSETPGTGAVIDASGISAAGSSFGNVAIDGSSLVGQGYSFDGTGDYVTIPRNATIEPTGSFTISCWFKTAGTQRDYAKMFSKGQAGFPYSSYTLEMRPNAGPTNHNEEVGFQTARTTNYVLTDSNGNGKIDITTGQWYFFAGVISDAGGPNITQSFYLDGDLISSSTALNTEAVNFYGGTYNLTIGALFDGGINNEFQGTIDELRISNVARSTDFLKTQVLNTACVSNFLTVTGNITGLSCTDGTVPVKFVEFKAKKTNRDVVLNWSTATEENNDFFTVERSYDGKNYEALQKIDGAGNSNNLLKYGYTDRYVNSNIVYYRIKQTDFDGTSDYSKVQKVIGQEQLDGLLSVYPNPSQGDQINVAFSKVTGSQLTISLRSISGKLMQQEVIVLNGETNWVHSLNTNQLTPGTYILSVKTDGQNFVERIVKY